MILLRFAWRELVHNWRFGLFFIFNLSLGLAGFLSLQSFNRALEDEIRNNSKSILSADLAVSSRREFTESELQNLHQLIPSGTVEGKTYEFFAMLNSKKGSRLVLVKAIDKTYPLYGELILKSGKKISNLETQKNRPSVGSSDSLSGLMGQKNVWIYPELKSQMGLDVDDEIQLGELHLKVADIVEKDQTQTFRAASMAPRVFIDRDLLPSSGLIQFGSTFTASYLFKFPIQSQELDLTKEIYEKLTDPQISVDSPKTAGESAGRQLGYLSDYLGLVALIALFMSALGASYMYKLFLASRLKEVAVLRTLGLQSEQAVGVYVIQASMLGFFATIPAILFSELISPLLTKLLATFSPFNLSPSVNLETIVICMIMAVLGSLVLGLPFIVRILDLKAAKLFSEEKFTVSLGRVNKYWPYLPGLLLFYGLAVHQSHSWKTGSLFIASLLIVLCVLLVVGYLFIRGTQLFKGLKVWTVKYSFLSLARRANSSLAVFVALGVGALLINILPQLKNSIQADFKIDNRSKTPSLFMFDIQEEQLPKIHEVLDRNKIEALLVSPMVRARILSVNGKDYERKIEAGGFKTREEETDARFRNRGVNLSYREQLSQTEEIVEGRAMTAVFDPQKQKYAELSVEKKFAERMGFSLNDLVVFDVQGVSVEGQVVNFRKVKWTSFQPNFFILVQNGVLNEAPKTFIAAVPSLKASVRNQLQTDLASAVSNVSIIDVVRLVDELLSTADKMSWSLELMAYLALFTGYVVLYSIVRSQMKVRRWELNMLKILGADKSSMVGFILTEFAFLSLLSSTLGAFLSIAVSFILNRFMFEGSFQWSFSQPLISVIMITGLSVVISLLAALDIIKESPLSILRQES